LRRKPLPSALLHKGNKMSRQRTINDQRFWRSPRLQICTTEDKIALLHLLTCPDSNIVGAYALVPKIASAEVGWSPEQWLQVIDRLRANDLTWFDTEHMFVWVRIWWEHHHAGQSMGPKLRNRTLADIRRIPQPWQQHFLEDFRPRLPQEYRPIVDLEFGQQSLDDPSQIPYGYGIDTSSNFSLGNANAKNITLTPTLQSPALPVDIFSIPATQQDGITGVLKQAQESGRTAAELQKAVDSLAQQFRSCTSPPRNAPALLQHLLNQTPRDNASRKVPQQTLAALRGRCFAWPLEQANSYARIEADGLYELFRIERGQLTRRIGRLEQDGLLFAIQAGSVQEVSADSIDQLATELMP